MFTLEKKLRKGRRTEEGGEQQEKVLESTGNTTKWNIRNTLKMKLIIVAVFRQRAYLHNGSCRLKFDF